MSTRARAKVRARQGVSSMCERVALSLGTSRTQCVGVCAFVWNDVEPLMGYKVYVSIPNTKYIPADSADWMWLPVKTARQMLIAPGLQVKRGGHVVR